MAYGECIASRSQTSDPPLGSAEKTTNEDGDDSRSIDNLSMSLAAGPQKFEAEDQLDQHRTKSLVSRRMKYARDTHSDWADNLESIAL